MLPLAIARWSRRLLLLIVITSATAAGAGEPSIAVAAGEPSAPDLTPLVIETARGPVTFAVEFAATPEARRRGLQERTSLAADRGMLFDFGKPAMQQMWMKDTPIPLDMLFIDGDGRIISIIERTEPYSLQPVGASQPARAVLEISGGRAGQLGIRPGDRVRQRIFP